ncbi:MAG: hypothetical protein FJ290_03240 [Planctomycetes bacterium]|nr:hypothetical protein [Planctomycetota bacterium]
MTENRPESEGRGAKGAGGQLDAAADRVVRRCVAAGWAALLGRTVLPFCIVVAATSPVVPRSSSLSLHALTLLLWLLATAAWAWLRRPGQAEAMAFWDERAGRHEMLLSAWSFARLREPGPGERLHLAKAVERLRAELPLLARHVPVRVPRRVWAAPAAILAFAILGPALRGASPDTDDALTPEAAARAAREAAAVADGKTLLDPLKGLTPEERKAAAELKRSLEETAKQLEGLSRETPREVLEELERRAAAAEKLAESLGVGADELLSSAALAELERHADTSDFASQVRARALQKIAAEAEKLAERLRTDALARNEQKRIEEALDKALKAATDADRQRAIGKHLAASHRQLQAGDTKGAADSFQALARHFAQAAQRQHSQRQLQQLAQSLRATGQRIFGGKQAGVQRLAQSCANGMTPTGDGAASASGAMPLPRWAMGPRPSPAGQGAPSGVPGRCPVPGTGSGQSGSQGAGQGAGMTPVPGTDGMGAAGAQPGGLHAGRGTAPYGGRPTAPIRPRTTQSVAVALRGDGPSDVRTIEGTNHSEEAARQARQLAVQFLRAEEEALAEEPLPLLRREQVLRYFSTLRRRIENEPAAKP